MQRRHLWSLAFVATAAILVCAPTGCKKTVVGNAQCGNGRLDPGEDCDDGNHIGGDGCTALCTAETATEVSCDDGIDDDGDGYIDCADSDCATAAACGGEDCSNNIDDDGDGQTDCADSDCATNPVCAPPNCGNGALDAGEQCDDGNNVGGDGCGPTCLLEAARDCLAATAIADVTSTIDSTTVRGVVGGLASYYQGSCDTAGPLSPESIVTFTITQTTSLRLSTDHPGTDFDSILYVRQGSCDDPRTEIACDNDVTGNVANLGLYNLDPGTYFVFIDGNNGDAGNYELGLVTAGCGDGIIDGPLGESCDDGNTTAGDGCDPSCHVEPQQCTQGGPFTDITANIDATTITGTLPAGNGVIDDASCDNVGAEGEEHIYKVVLTNPTTLRLSTDEPGTQVDTVLHVRNGVCDDVGQEVGCANPFNTNVATLYLNDLPPGTYWIFVDANNGDNGDYELRLTSPVCGDGIVDQPLGENCDDGNTTSGDGCSATCRTEFGACNAADFTADLSTGSDALQIDTNTASDDIIAPCANGAPSGNDVWIAFTVPTDGMTLNVAWDQGGGSDHVFGIATDESGTCSWNGCFDPQGQNVGNFTTPPLPAGTYFLIVDAVNPGDESVVDLTLTLN